MDVSRLFGDSSETRKRGRTTEKAYDLFYVFAFMYIHSSISFPLLYKNAVQ